MSKKTTRFLISYFFKNDFILKGMRNYILDLIIKRYCVIFRYILVWDEDDDEEEIVVM